MQGKLEVLFLKMEQNSGLLWFHTQPSAITINPFTNIVYYSLPPDFNY
jgi:hypothetical protein